MAGIVRASGARVLTVGDPAQLDAVGLPGLHREIVEASPTVALSEVRRHRDPDDRSRPHPWLREYQELLRGGRADAALEVLRRHQAIRFSDTREQAMVALVDDWDSWRRDYAPEDTMLLVHGSNEDVDTVNVLAQARRWQASELTDERVAAVDRPYDLRVGDAIVLRNAPYIDARQPRVENGTPGVVVAADAGSDRIAVRIREANGRRRLVVFDLNRLRQLPPERVPALRLAYAMHPSPAQGATVKRSASLFHPTADRAAAYVADTRAVFGHTVHVAREDLGLDGTDDDRLLRLAERLAADRFARASVAYAPDDSRALTPPRPQRGVEATHDL